MLNKKKTWKKIALGVLGAVVAAGAIAAVTAALPPVGVAIGIAYTVIKAIVSAASILK